MSETTQVNKPPETTHPEDNGGATGKTFTQEEVNRIVSDRLAREKAKTEPPQEDEREKALKARESRLDCRDYLDKNKYPIELLDVLDCYDIQKFKGAAEKLMQLIPSIVQAQTPIPPPYATGTGTGLVLGDDAIAAAFKPKN